MKKRKYFRNGAFLIASLLFASNANADLSGITSPVDTSGGDVTNNETISGSDSVTVTGGKTLFVGGTGSTLTGDWIVESGTTLATNNLGNGKESPDNVFGSGTIRLNGASLRVVQTGKAGGYERRISNNIAINGDCQLTSENATEMFVFGNITGSGTITESVVYSLRLRGDNSAYTGNWVFTNDWVWPTGTDSKTSYGTGTIKVTGGGLGISNADYTFSNNLEIAGSNTTLLNGGTKVTVAGKITGAGAFNFQKTFNGDGSVAINTPTNLVLTGDNSGYTGAWNITGSKAADETISWQTVSTNNSGAEKETVDSRFGSGTINLNYGIIEAAVHPTRVSNNIVVTNAAQFTGASKELHLFGNISGAGDIYRQGDWSTFLHGDNSAFTGNWFLNRDWTWAYNTGQTEKVGTGDYSFGSGTIKSYTGGIHLGVNDLILSADLEIYGYDSRNTPFMGGNTATMTSKLTGTIDFQLNNNSPATFYMRGNGSEYTKNWIVDATAAGKSLALYSNSTASVTDGVDPRFGSGTIFLKGGDGTTGNTARLGGESNGTRIYNPVVVSGNVILDDRGDAEIHYVGNFSGSGMIKEDINWTFYLDGDNSAYTGNWDLTGDFCCITNDGKTASVANPDGDLRFGTGTVYMNNGGIRTTGTGTRGFIDADLTIPAGKTGWFRYGPFTLRGVVTVDGTMNSDNRDGAYGDPVITIADGGTLQGTGSVQSNTIIGEGGILTVGPEGGTGALSFTRTLTVAAGSEIVLDIASGTDYDKIFVTGAADISQDAVIDVKLDNGFLPAGGMTFDIFSVGEGSTLPDDWKAMLSPATAFLFDADFANGTLTLTADAAAVPEPATWTLLILGLGAMVGLRRSSRRVNSAKGC